MITESQYLNAKIIVEKYEKQQQTKLESEDKWTKEGEEVIYFSNVLRLINKQVMNINY